MLRRQQPHEAPIASLILCLWGALCQETLLRPGGPLPLRLLCRPRSPQPQLPRQQAPLLPRPPPLRLRPLPPSGACAGASHSCGERLRAAAPAAGPQEERLRCLRAFAVSELRGDRSS